MAFIIENNLSFKGIGLYLFSVGRGVENVKNHAKLQRVIKSFVMTIQQAQQNVDDWIKTTGVRYFNELTNMAMLTEEVGEVARIIAPVNGQVPETASPPHKTTCAISLSQRDFSSA